MEGDAASEQDVLEGVPIFGSLPAEDREQLLQSSSRVRYRRNTVVVSTDDESYSLYLILEGRVRIYRSDEEGRELTINMLGPGDCFGELAALTELPRSASVMTSTDCELLLISRRQFHELLGRNPPMALDVIQQLVLRIHDLIDEVTSFGLQDVYGRLLRVLNRHGVEQPDGRVVVEGFNQRELATMVGSSREMVSRLFRDLRAGGYVTTEGSTIIIEKTLPARW